MLGRPASAKTGYVVLRMEPPSGFRSFGLPVPCHVQWGELYSLSTSLVCTPWPAKFFARDGPEHERPTFAERSKVCGGWLL